MLNAVSITRELSNKLIAAVPQLLSVSSISEGGPALPGLDHVSTSDTGKVCIAPWARTRITLGPGMKFPAAREKPQDLVFKFWMKSLYTRHKKGPST